MSQQVRQLEPKALWNHFCDVNAIPRPPKKEERIIQLMVDFGKRLNLETTVDAVGNVILRKQATAGMENRKAVVLQSHLDMVHQKTQILFLILIPKELICWWMVTGLGQTERHLEQTMVLEWQL